MLWHFAVIDAENLTGKFEDGIAVDDLHSTLTKERFSVSLRLTVQARLLPSNTVLLDIKDKW